jgi:hypothetical protein
MQKQGAGSPENILLGRAGLGNPDGSRFYVVGSIAKQLCGERLDHLTFVGRPAFCTGDLLSPITQRWLRWHENANGALDCSSAASPIDTKPIRAMGLR